MALPFLPEDQIRPIYDLLNLEDFILNTENMNNFTIFKNYIRKQRINCIPSNELSVFNCQFRTNNGEENYHGRLKKDIVVAHPRIWFFVEVLNRKNYFQKQTREGTKEYQSGTLNLLKSNKITYK